MVCCSTKPKHILEKTLIYIRKAFIKKWKEFGTPTPHRPLARFALFLFLLIFRSFNQFANLKGVPEISALLPFTIIYYFHFHIWAFKTFLTLSRFYFGEEKRSAPNCKFTFCQYCPFTKNAAKRTRQHARILDTQNERTNKRNKRTNKQTNKAIYWGSMLPKKIWAFAS